MFTASVFYLTHLTDSKASPDPGVPLVTRTPTPSGANPLDSLAILAIVVIVSLCVAFVTFVVSFFCCQCLGYPAIIRAWNETNHSPQNVNEASAIATQSTPEYTYGARNDLA
jgi:hypothetical protein